MKVWLVRGRTWFALSNSMIWRTETVVAPEFHKLVLLRYRLWSQSCTVCCCLPEMTRESTKWITIKCLYVTFFCSSLVHDSHAHFPCRFQNELLFSSNQFACSGVTNQSVDMLITIEQLVPWSIQPSASLESLDHLKHTIDLYWVELQRLLRVTGLWSVCESLMLWQHVAPYPCTGEEWSSQKSIAVFLTQ